MTHLTTHVLDAATGTPAAGVTVTLAHLDGATIDSASTDADGRLALGPDRLADGDYALTFGTGAYFRARGVASFHPVATVAFTVAGEGHLHVPLLLSPFAYSTYRGS
ncbi:hydroxyisourate hydrolase [Microbacterium sp. Bi128]|uniref:hydroxyisourate hydrolase n=1 Tax=Microbacterium sp. Bi128 TaxID=2821115 RepID=UPI001DC35F23|nr:hydroxyisourate hydrolase [Microbacterium sp. Bi128]CAH0167948.1 5-hydroxyisourate hydrolase [Microbacterium sp. Bi128]